MALIYGSSNSKRSGDISRKIKAGKLRKLASKLYTDDLRTEPSEIMRRHRLEIAAHFYPGAVISHRSALEERLSPAGKLHISLPQKVAPIRKLPGLEIRIWKGPAAQAEDIRMTIGGNESCLYIASQTRAILENLQIARARANDEPKTLSKEAQEIVKETKPAKALERKRPEDAHDILETYRLIVDKQISSKVATDSQKYIELIKIRHARMMASRTRLSPGEFKERNNEVGSRVFVRPELVKETLARSWLSACDIKSPTARAFFMLFVVSEVHPFQDGNGRISRLSMNAILENAGRSRLIIPTSFRNDYLTVLEALTISENPKPFCQFAQKLVELNERMPLESFEQSYEYYRKTGALDEPKPTHLNLLSIV